MTRQTLFVVALAAVAACGGGERPAAAPIGGRGRGASDTIAVAPRAGAQPKIASPAEAPTEEEVDATIAVHAHPRCVLAVSLAAARGASIAKIAAPVLAAMPPFDALAARGFDPLKDADWFLYTAPRFYPNDASAFLLRTPADALPLDGTPTIDRFPRALLHPQPHVFALVPPSLAAQASDALGHGRVVSPLGQGEAVRLRVRRPGALLPLVPESVYEARAWATLRDDGGAELFADLDAPFESEAIVVANDLRRAIARLAAGPAGKAAHGLLDGIDVKPAERVVHVHATASAEQVAALLALFSARLPTRAPH